MSIIKKSDQKGSYLLLIIIIVAVVGILGFLGYALVKNFTDKEPSGQESSGYLSKWKTDCSGTGDVRMTHTPMDIDDIDLIQPIGLLAAAHVTPIDHLYLFPKDMSKRDAAPVYSMADGYVVELEDRGSADANGKAASGALRMVVQYNCDIYSYYDLMTSISPDLYKKLKAGGAHVPIKAGEEIGRVGMQTLDTAMYDLSMNLPGFVNPATYELGEPWKIHTDDFFKYFDEPYRSQMLALNPRKIEPYGGKIDYDIPGKLVGNWFEVGTNGYAGPQDIVRTNSLGDAGYFSGHFAIVPDSVYPTLTNVSFGDYEGKPMQFTVKAENRNPAEVGVADGIVKYELTRYKQPSFSAPTIDSFVSGTVLLQVLENNKMKLEAFPRKTAGEVNGFTDAAKTYER